MCSTHLKEKTFCRRIIGAEIKYYKLFYIKNMEPKYDSVVSSIISKFEERARIGQIKYGKTLDRNDLSFLEWINHAQEELMDGILYLEKIKKLTQPTNT